MSYTPQIRFYDAEGRLIEAGGITWTPENMEKSDSLGRVIARLRRAEAIGSGASWGAGSPCGSCGSSDTGWDAIHGGYCNNCGLSDMD